MKLKNRKLITKKLPHRKFNALVSYSSALQVRQQLRETKICPILKIHSKQLL